MKDKNNDKEIFKEKLLLNGFKLVAVEEINKLPTDKKAFLLKTKNKKLQRELKRWASKNDVVILINPERIKHKHCKRLFAFVIDDEFKNQMPEEKHVTRKLIDAQEDRDSIKDFLNIHTTSK